MIYSNILKKIEIFDKIMKIKKNRKIIKLKCTKLKLRVSWMGLVARYILGRPNYGTRRQSQRVVKKEKQTNSKK
jgi:hypothetical protein